MPVVDLYFDYISPFAYLASIVGPEACARHGAEVRFRPVLFPGLLNHWGQKGPAEIPPKGLHAFLACLRYARVRGIPFRGPTFHPFNPLPALRATLAAGSDAERSRCVRVIFDLGWKTGGDLGDPNAIEEALSNAGLDGKGLVARAATDEIKGALRRETEAAIDRGVFGIPTFFVGDTLFWGIDQLEYVEMALDGHDPLAGVDVGELAPKGIGAVRPVHSANSGTRGD